MNVTAPPRTLQATTGSLPLLARVHEVLTRSPAPFVELASRGLRAAKLYCIDDEAIDVLHPPLDDREELDRLLERGDFRPRTPFSWIEGQLDGLPTGLLSACSPLANGDYAGRGFLILEHDGQVAMFGDLYWHVRRGGALLDRSYACAVHERLASRPNAVEAVATFCWPFLASFALLNDSLATITASPLAAEQAEALAATYGQRADGYSIVNTIGIRRGRAAA